MHTKFVTNTERKRLLGRPRPRWEDNIKTLFTEIGCGVNLSGLTYSTNAGLSEHVRNRRKF
jgi:hypothetical protein